MKQLKIAKRKGFSAEQALKDVSFNATDPKVRGCNSTRSWIMAGKPIPGSDDFLDWAEAQLAFKTKNEVGFGCYIIIEPAISDIRVRPYTVVKFNNTECRKWKTVHQVRTDVLDAKMSSIDNHLLEPPTIKEVGKVIGEFETKDQALRFAKRYIAKTKENCTIVRVKVTEETPIEAFCVYTPSSNAKEGTFIAFGYVDE